MGVEQCYDLVSGDYVHQLTQALRAKELYKRDKDTSSPTARSTSSTSSPAVPSRVGAGPTDCTTPVEAKKSACASPRRNHTYTPSPSRLYRLYEKLGGMTGTAETEAAEFGQYLNVPVVPIPPTCPWSALDQPTSCYKSEDAKFDAVVRGPRSSVTNGPACSRRYGVGGKSEAAGPVCS